MVVDASRYAWKAAEWKRPAWNGQVVYEIHVGTFTKSGTYQAAIEQLDYLVSLGITALEIMPIAEFPGERNWGYDGVMLFAPSHSYGTPDDFRALIDACHLRGLAVILDVVYNHLGPEGDFSHHYSDFFFQQGKDNPWGKNFNLDGPKAEAVRSILRQNIRYWLDEFRIDGFRVDATQMIHDDSPVHLLAEVAEIVHSRGGFIIAEDDRNERMILEPRERNGWGFDAVWSDDFHHAARVSQTGEQEHLLSMYDGTAEEIAGVVRCGWLYTGQFSKFHQQNRGTPGDDFPPQSFVYSISNHDQVGNRWRGTRFHESIDPAGYRALSLFLCLAPYTPLLFMGQEWAASAPFHYFTNLSDELGKKIVEDRGREFLAMGFVKDTKELEQMPNPQAEKSFLDSKVDWVEQEKPFHSRMLALYQAGLQLRREWFGGENPPRRQWHVESDENGVTIHYRLKRGRIAVHVRIKSGGESPLPPGVIVLSSNSPEFAGTTPALSPETVVLIES